MRIIASRRLYEYFTKFCTCAVVCFCLMITASFAASVIPFKGIVTANAEPEIGEESKETSYREEKSAESPEMSEETSAAFPEESACAETSEEFPRFANEIPEVNLSQYGLGDVPVMKVIDQTDYSPDIAEYESASIKTGGIVSDKPTVLIYHTHGTERYASLSTYPDGYEFNSTDTSENVVAVGDCLAECLEDLGIGVIHDRTMYDADGYTTSYSRSKKAVKELLAAYPSIEYVIDIHRDSVESDGKQAKTVTLFDGNCAQVMIVVGTDAGGSSHKGWKDNFACAVRLQETMNSLYPTFARPIYLRTASFNQELSAGSLLIEVGACGNTLEEAKKAASLLATSLKNAFDTDK